MNIISNLLAKYSLNKLATITGVSIAVLRDLRAGKIPDHITLHSGSYIPARSVLKSQIIAAVKKYKLDIKSVA